MKRSPTNGVPLSAFSSSVESEFLSLTAKAELKPPISVIFPPFLEKFVQSIFSEAFIKSNGIRLVKYASIVETPNVATVVFVTPPDAEALADVLPYFKKAPNYSKSIFVIPRTNAYVDQFIAANGYTAVSAAPAHNSTEIYLAEFHADFVTVEDSYFLLPCHNSFSRIFIDHDMTDLFSTARALAKIQTVFGPIPQIVTVGQNAEKVCDLMKGIMNQCNVTSTTVPQIDTLLVFDRIAEMVTPFIYSTTSEQLIDDLMGISYGRLDHNGKLISFKGSNPCVAKYRALSVSQGIQHITGYLDQYKHSEELISGMKSASIQESKIKAQQIMQTVQLKPFYEEQTDIFDKAIRATKSIPYYESLRNASYDILDGNKVELMEEHLISMFNDWKDALRLMCMESATGLSHSSKFVRVVHREAIAEFGAKAMESMLNLERLRLLSEQKYFYDWKDVAKEGKLTESGKQDDEGHYHFKDPLMDPMEGFCPLSVRIAERVAGDVVKPFQKLVSPQVKMTVTGEKPKRVETEARRILVFFIGGVTLTEAGMIRSIGENSEGKYEFIIGSTEQINGNSIITQICPCLN